MGKSAFALEIANHVAVDQQTPCAFFSLEMSRQEVAQRLICSRGKVDAHHIRTGKLSKDDWPRLTEACGQLESAPLYVDDTPALSLLELRARAQTLKRREPNLGLVVVDYLQLMTTGRSEESRLQEVSSISRGLKEIAKDLDLPVIALSQLNRSPEQRHDKRPMLSDLRESGSIEQDADVVDVPLPRGVLRPRRCRRHEEGRRRGDRRQAPQRPDRRLQRRLHQPLREVRHPCQH